MDTNGLIGREAPLAILAAALATAGDQGEAILLVGERGIGKTACLLAAQQTAQEAAYQVVYTAGSEAESAFPFAGLHRLLQPLLGMADAMPPVQRRGLLTALGIQDGPSPEPFLVSLATLSLLSRAAALSPLLICVDDLQWLDEVSRRAVTFAARRPGARTAHEVVIATSPSRCGTCRTPCWTPSVRSAWRVWKKRAHAGCSSAGPPVSIRLTPTGSSAWPPAIRWP